VYFFRISLKVHQNIQDGIVLPKVVLYLEPANDSARSILTLPIQKDIDLGLIKDHDRVGNLIPLAGPPLEGSPCL
jgi:hypothetical protein